MQFKGSVRKHHRSQKSYLKGISRMSKCYFNDFLLRKKRNKKQAIFCKQKNKLKIFFSAKKARGLYFSSSQAKTSGQFVPEQIFSPLWPIINPTSTLLIITYLPKEYITPWAKNGKKIVQ